MNTRVAPREQVEQYGEGMCVAMREKNMYHDSYFSGVFAVPDGEGGFSFVTKETGATAYAGGFVPVEDASPEVLAAYRVQRAEVMAVMAGRRAEQDKRRVTPGKPVTVVEAVTRGKNKVAVGVTGVVDRREVNAFDSRWAKATDNRSFRVRVVLDDEDRVVWVDEAKVRVTGFEGEDLPVEGSMVDYAVAASWPDR